MRPAAGAGLGTEATRLVVDHGFRVLGLHRITLEVYDFNPRARHVYEKVGFVHEGTGREALLFDGEWVDVHFMAVLEPDWVSVAGDDEAGPTERGVEAAMCGTLCRRPSPGHSAQKALARVRARPRIAAVAKAAKPAIRSGAPTFQWSRGPGASNPGW